MPIDIPPISEYDLLLISVLLGHSAETIDARIAAIERSQRVTRETMQLEFTV